MNVRTVLTVATAIGLAVAGPATGAAAADPDRALPRGVYQVGESPRDVALSDFDADGTLDLAVTSGRFVYVLLGDGRGGYGAATAFPVGGSSGPAAVATGDLDGDGDADIVTANGNDGTVTVLRGRPGGIFKAPVKASTPARQLVDIVLGDLDGDGALDVVVSDLQGAVYGLLGDGAGGLGSTFTIVAAAGSEFASRDALAVTDVNADGVLDLVVTRHLAGTVAVLVGFGDGGFSEPTSFPATEPRELIFVGLAAADLDGDGAIDLAVTDNRSSVDDQVAVLLGDGDGGFGPPAGFTVGLAPQAVTAADFDGDGVPDLAVANAGTNNLSLLTGDGSGSFGPARNVSTRGECPSSVAAGDVESDGDVDLAVVNNCSNTVAVGLNRPGRGATVSFGLAG